MPIFAASAEPGPQLLFARGVRAGEVVNATKHYNLASREPGWGHIHPTNHAHIVIPSMGLMLVGNSMLCSASTNTGLDISKLGLSPATQT